MPNWENRLTPDTPRPLSRCGAMVGPGEDARWRGVLSRTTEEVDPPIYLANRLDVLEDQLRAREEAPSTKGSNPL
jgi:hypothetical protein